MSSIAIEQTYMAEAAKLVSHGLLNVRRGSLMRGVRRCAQARFACTKNSQSNGGFQPEAVH